jgi:hypothetical protein
MKPKFDMKPRCVYVRETEKRERPLVLTIIYTPFQFEVMYIIVKKNFLNYIAYCILFLFLFFSQQKNSNKCLIFFSYY